MPSPTSILSVKSLSVRLGLLPGIDREFAVLVNPFLVVMAVNTNIKIKVWFARKALVDEISTISADVALVVVNPAATPPSVLIKELVGPEGLALSALEGPLTVVLIVILLMLELEREGENDKCQYKICFH